MSAPAWRAALAQPAPRGRADSAAIERALSGPLRRSSATISGVLVAGTAGLAVADALLGGVVGVAAATLLAAFAPAHVRIVRQARWLARDGVLVRAPVEPPVVPGLRFARLELPGGTLRVTLYAGDLVPAPSPEVEVLVAPAPHGDHAAVVHAGVLYLGELVEGEPPAHRRRGEAAAPVALPAARLRRPR